MSEQTILSLSTDGQGLYEFTRELESWIDQKDMSAGVCHLFIKHTSCSLTIQENADPSARADLENWLNRLVPENDPLYTHTMEGPDDMPAHIKAILTNVSVTIPIVNGRLALGTWQGVYLWEHRHQSHRRQIIAHITH
jgi:secondary thiamine-phosphate synthase enzyme